NQESATLHRPYSTSPCIDVIHLAYEPMHSTSVSRGRQMVVSFAPVRSRDESEPLIGKRTVDKSSRPAPINTNVNAASGQRQIAWTSATQSKTRRCTLIAGEGSEQPVQQSGSAKVVVVAAAAAAAGMNRSQQSGQLKAPGRPDRQPQSTFELPGRSAKTEENEKRLKATRSQAPAAAPSGGALATMPPRYIVIALASCTRCRQESYMYPAFELSRCPNHFCPAGAGVKDRLEGEKFSTVPHFLNFDKPKKPRLCCYCANIRGRPSAGENFIRILIGNFITGRNNIKIKVDNEQVGVDTLGRTNLRSSTVRSAVSMELPQQRSTTAATGKTVNHWQAPCQQYVNSEVTCPPHQRPRRLRPSSNRPRDPIYMPFWRAGVWHHTCIKYNDFGDFWWLANCQASTPKMRTGRGADCHIPFVRGKEQPAACPIKENSQARPPGLTTAASVLAHGTDWAYCEHRNATGVAYLKKVGPHKNIAAAKKNATVSAKSDKNATESAAARCAAGALQALKRLCEAERPGRPGASECLGRRLSAHQPRFGIGLRRNGQHKALLQTRETGDLRWDGGEQLTAWQRSTWILKR
uniref:DNA helicase n=1 Tax=Macrostomum lignano TaxID=282301 RepID=A0A1I8FQN2_9PLAT